MFLGIQISQWWLQASSVKNFHCFTAPTPPPSSLTCTICTICTCKTCQFLNMCQTARSQSHVCQFATFRDWAGLCAWIENSLILCCVCVNISDAEVFIEEHSDVSYFVCVFVCLGLLFQRRPAYHFHYRFPHGEFTSREIIQITLWK